MTPAVPVVVAIIQDDSATRRIVASRASQQWRVRHADRTTLLDDAQLRTLLRTEVTQAASRWQLPIRHTSTTYEALSLFAASTLITGWRNDDLAQHAVDVTGLEQMPDWLPAVDTVIGQVAVVIQSPDVPVRVLRLLATPLGWLEISGDAEALVCRQLDEFTVQALLDECVREQVAA